MKVLAISLDARILEAGSAVERRMLELSEKTGEITIFVSAKKDEMKVISSHLAVYAVGGFKLWQFLKLWRRVGKELHERPYNLITVQDIYFLGFLAVQLGKRFSIPVEVQVHGLEQFSGLRKLIAGFVLRRADMIRVVSKRLKRQLTTNYQLPTTKLYTLPVYTQVEKNMKYRIQNREKEQFTFLTVGRLVPVKNIALQIRALARLLKEFPNARLVVVGDGRERDNLQFTTDSLKLGKKVIFEGRQDEVEAYYEVADAFLLTSDYEGWGVAVTEAAAYGLPIIMTDVGLAGEFVHNEENGLVVSVGDETALVSAMKRFMVDAGLRARLGDVARASFLKLSSPEEQKRKQIAEWQMLIEEFTSHKNGTYLRA